jgi:ketosteroid isomerase-like protein
MAGPTDADPRAVIERFYRAFAARDGAAMAACYAPDVIFSDPVFPRLEGAQAGAMWRMLCQRARDLTIESTGITATGGRGRARWTARYTFVATGRKVVNVVDADFELRDGRIVRHTDRFGFWRWARQALGPLGLLLGWSGLVRKKVRAQAAQSLAAWQKEEVA